MTTATKSEVILGAAKVPEHTTLPGKDGKPLKDKKGKVRTRTVFNV